MIVLFRVFRSATPPHLCALSLATCIEGYAASHILEEDFCRALSGELGLASCDQDLVERSIVVRKAGHQLGETRQREKRR